MFVVIGGSKGIGLECVKEILNSGAIVHATSRNDPSTNNPKLIWHHCDLTSPKSIDAFLRSLPNAPIDGVILNAGDNSVKSIEDYESSDVNRIFQLNLVSHFQLIKGLLVRLKQSKHPKIVGVSSIWGGTGAKQRSLYSATKGGMEAMYRALADELAPNVLVNTVSPGFTATELTTRSLGKEGIDKLSEYIPLQRLADPKEVARLIWFLCSPENTYISGQCVTIDGGFSTSAKCL